MKNFLSNPGFDGCGRYGRHIAGTRFGQVYYCNQPISVLANLALVADKDYLVPIKPPSETITINSIAFTVGIAGTASFVRPAIFDFESLTSPVLIIDAGEVASDAIANVEVVIASTTLFANRRYGLLLCGRGAVLPSLSGVAQGYVSDSWAGGMSLAFFGLLGNLGMERFSRVNGAFPAVYNGVPDVPIIQRFYASFRMP